MENAIYITKIRDLKLFNKKYSRIYLGNEFCERLMLPYNQLPEVIKFVKNNNVGFTLVTPYLTDKYLLKAIKIIKFLDFKLPSYEVVINDWGLFNLIKKNNFKNINLVLGRLLTKQKRGPRIVNIRNKISKETFNHFQRSYIEVEDVQEFLIDNEIFRVEFDNLIQGIDINLKKSKLSCSLYFPYLYVTTTRACFANGCEDKNKLDKIGVFPCKKECQKYTVKLTHKTLPTPLITKGNAVFIKNTKLPDKLEKMGFDRLVYQPKVPI